MTQPPIFDGHNDTLTKHEASWSFLDEHSAEAGHLDLPRARKGGLIGGIYAIFTPPPPDSPESDPMYGLTFTADGYDVRLNSSIDPEDAQVFTDAAIQRLDDLVHESNGQLRVVKSLGDLERHLVEGVHSIVLHIEGAAAIREDLSNLEAYYRRGVRSLGIVWSRPNVFGCGVPFRYPHSPDTGPGLTEAGKALIRACNRLGIMIDLAHINERGFWDVAALTEAPLVVTHAGVHALCTSTRNLTDAQIDAVGESDGVIGVIFEPVNTRSDGRPGAETPLSAIGDHIAYITERIGVDHVAFGSDFDGADMPAALTDAAGLPRLMDTLRERGFDDTELEKIAYRNWFRVLSASWHSPQH